MKKRLSSLEREIHSALCCRVSSSRRLYLWMLLLTYGLFAANTLLLSPLWSSLASDVLIHETIPNLISALMYLIHLSVIPATAWSIIGFAYFRRESGKVIRRLTLMYFGSLFFCRICDMAAALMINGSLYLEEDIIYPLWYLVLDLIYNALLFLLLRAFVMKHRHREVATIQTSMAVSPKETLEIKSLPLYPFGGIYKKGHAILRAAACFGLIFIAVAILQEIVYTVAIFYDSARPLTGEEIFVMIGRYLDAILIGAAFYFLSLLFYRILFRKAKADEEDEAEEDKEKDESETEKASLHD